MALSDQVDNIEERVQIIGNLLISIDQKCDSIIENQIAKQPNATPVVPGMPIWAKPGDYATAHAMFKALKDRDMIQAIKNLRTLTGLGLKEAKDLIEEIYYHVKEK